MDNLGLVPIQNSLAFDVKRIEIKNKIITRIGELGLVISNYRNSTEFLLLILNLIEHLVVKKDKINKKELAIEILNEVFGLNELERNNVDSNIEFLHQNKNIKKVSMWKLFKCGVKELFFSKRHD
jgi:hypothetical protein